MPQTERTILGASPPNQPGGRVREVLTVMAVTVVAVAGYGGFRLAANLDLGAEAGAGVVALAVVTGFAVFFSPCSFPLLLTMLARPGPAANRGHRRRESLMLALAMGAGATVFLLLVGVVVGLAGEAVAQSVSFSTTPGRILRGAVASVIVGAGLTQLGFIRLPFGRATRFAQPVERRRVMISDQHQHAAQVLYGFGFVVAGFG